MPKKIVRIALVSGGFLFLLGGLRESARAIGFLYSQYAELHKYQSILLRKIEEQAPEIFEDPEVMLATDNYVFFNIATHIESEKK